MQASRSTKPIGLPAKENQVKRLPRHILVGMMKNTDRYNIESSKTEEGNNKEISLRFIVYQTYIMILFSPKTMVGYSKKQNLKQNKIKS